jgi:uncharacterized protein YecE (DUF72 family)
MATALAEGGLCDVGLQGMAGHAVSRSPDPARAVAGVRELVHRRGNTTFYGLPVERTVTAWTREAPDGFRFVFKLPRAITHQHHLRDVDADHRAFLERLAPLDARAEQLSIQLPPSCGRPPLHPQGALVPRPRRYAVELRHRAFYDDLALEARVEELLGGAGVEWISLDTTTLYGDVLPSRAGRSPPEAAAPSTTAGPDRPAAGPVRRHRRS